MPRSQALSAGAILTAGRRVLLVHHRKPGEFDFWVPPGGSVEAGESIPDCARREVFEETGLVVAPERLVYTEEFMRSDTHFCKLWFLCRLVSGELTLENRRPGGEDLVGADFRSREDLWDVEVFPRILKDRFWDDLEAGFPEARHLGFEGG